MSMLPFFRFIGRGHYPFILSLLLLSVCALGLLMLYSAGNGLHPWASRQMVHMGVGFVLFVVISYIDLRFWLTHATLLFGLTLALLIAVELLGFIGMGAKRWIHLYLFQVQPSELTKLSLILLVASHFHFLGEKAPKLDNLVIPVLAIVASSFLVLRQPDLGTALILVAVGVSMLFAAGTWWGVFVTGGFTFLLSLPVAWTFLRAYQKRRILTFLNPDSDPLGGGYHLLQSKIAVGSGGVFGKGLGQGTQSQLDFLPEKQTDFIFTLLCEEWGLMGALLLFVLFMGLLVYGYWTAFRCNALFTKLVVVGVMSMFFFHIFMNVGMVLGVLPIVGIPLPLMSYGGTSLMTFMVGFGWVAAARAQHHVRLPFGGEHSRDFF
ncbi:rod shape-determining protein RodA [bacterium NHP-B]|nr:rod shape-determining protein RodA [bacterium NHP-B]